MRKRITRTTGFICFIVSGFLGIPLLTNCNSTESTVPPVAIGYITSILSSPFFIAEKQKFWKQEGLEITGHEFVAGRLVLDAILGGSIAMGTVAETPLVNAALQGHEYVILGTYARSVNVKCLARGDENKNVAPNLKGKKIATYLGTTAEFYTDLLLQKMNLERKDVQIINLKPSNMVQALVSGEVDVACIWEPHIFYMKSQLEDRAADLPKVQEYVATFNLVSTKDYVDENPLIVDKVLRALLRAEQFIATKKDQSIEIVGEKIGMDSQTLDAIWSDYNFTFVLEPYLIDIMTQQADWSRKRYPNRSVVRENAFRSYVYDAPLRKIKPQAITLKENE